MTAIDPQAARQFAHRVVEKLRAAEFEALWAGGCVRDQLLGRQPKDYDVATNATPDEIRAVFGHRRTLAIGAAFGVITVLGQKSEGQIEVATFRQDAAYSDGRHPDSVTFSSAEEDAQRRDFTINGLFLDPLEDRVIDYVGGREDLAKGVVRAIGNPDQRIGEDMLRMLRAVRFAATFGFELDEGTADAIRRQSAELTVVSAERIAGEMRRMLTHPTRSRAVALLQAVNLLSVLLPEADSRQPDAWTHTLDLLERLDECGFPMALAGLLRAAAVSDTKTVVEQLGRRWKLSNDEVRSTTRLLENEPHLGDAHRLPWPKIQRILISPDVENLLRFAQTVCHLTERSSEGIEFCQRKLALPRDQLDPPPLIDGNDLQAAGIRPGPAFKMLLQRIRDAQLEGTVRTKPEAIAFAERLLE